MRRTGAVRFELTWARVTVGCLAGSATHQEVPDRSAPAGVFPTLPDLPSKERAPIGVAWRCSRRRGSGAVRSRTCKPRGQGFTVPSAHLCAAPYGTCGARTRDLSRDRGVLYPSELTLQARAVVERSASPEFLGWVHLSPRRRLPRVSYACPRRSTKPVRVLSSATLGCIVSPVAPRRHRALFAKHLGFPAVVAGYRPVRT